MNLSTSSIDHEDSKLCSPSKWLCNSPQQSNKTFHDKLASDWNSFHPNDELAKRSGNTDVYNWRKKAAESILSNSDDEHDMTPSPLSPLVDFSKKTRIPNIKNIPESHNNIPESTTTWDTLVQTSSHLSKVKTNGNQCKIMAPNVGKLSLSSCVEIHIQSDIETVRVLCSVDVLKMRSSYFQSILVSEEKSRLSNMNPNITNQNGLHSITSTPWRNHIIIQQNRPHDAASFLVTLHEGRIVGRASDWSLSWAKLCVNWGVDEFVEEYASQMSFHFSKILSCCEENHWRSNPSILMGLTVSFLQRHKNSSLTILCGTVIKSDLHNMEIQLDIIPNVSLQVPIDSIGYVNSPTRLPHMSSKTSSMLSPIGQQFSSSFSSNIHSGNNSPRNKLSNHSTLISRFPQPNETNETISFRPQLATFWIKVCDTNVSMKDMMSSSNHNNNTTESISSNVSNVCIENYQWLTPDEFSNTKLANMITHADKKKFWEMYCALTELPEFGLYMKCGPNSPKELGKLLGKPEFRILWISEGIDFLPKDVTTGLLVTAFAD